MADTSRESGGWLRQVHRLFCLGTVGSLKDGQLLDQFVTGGGEDSEAAFEELMHRHGPMVLRVCRGMLRDPQSAEDTFQATFLVLAQRAASIRRRDSVSSWLFGVALRVAAHSRLCAARRRSGERLVAGQTPEAYLPVERGDEREVLLEEIERLPEGLRGVVVLCYLEGLTYDAAAQRLGLSEGAVRGRLARARDQLRRRLIRRGVTISDGFLAAGTVAQACATQPLHLTASLVDSTIRMALGFKAGAAAAALARGVLRSMFMSNLRTAVVVILAAMGSSLVAWQTLAARDDGKAPLQTPKLELQTDYPRVENDPARQPTASSQKNQTDTVTASPKTGTLTVGARDLSTDAPVPDVRLEFSTFGGGSKTLATTDASGTARFSLPSDVHYLFVGAERDGLVPQAIRWDYDSNSPSPPDHLLFQMEKATTIAGRVVDQDQKPLAGATVVVDVSKRYPKSRQWINFKYESAKTDASGRWSFSGVPEKPDSVKLAAYHELCLTDQPFFHLADFKPLAELRNGSATLRLERGTRIEGTVVSPDGQPVAGAAVFYGMGRGFANQVPPVKTDAHGQFTLGIKPGTISTLTARAPGFGPTLQRIRVGPDPSRVDLRLQSPHVLKGRVVDPAGKPIAHASVTASWNGSETSAASGRGIEAIAQELTTDADGRFVWNDAPGSGVQARFYAKGFAGKDEWSLASDVDHEIVLIPPTQIKGAVVDGQTGQSIPQFILTLGAVWKREDPLLWQGMGMMKDARKTPGSFEHTLEQPAHQYVVRVSADGYLPEDSPRFSADGTLHAFTFRLTRAEPIRGAVLNPNGSPSGQSVVYLVPAEEEDTMDYLELQNGDVPAYERSQTINSKVGPDGRFSLPPQKTNYALVALADAGFAVVPRRDLRGDDVVRLRPWARVSGTVMFDGKPGANLELSASDPDRPRPIPGEPRIQHRFDIVTDAEGRFDLPRVMPGRLVIARRVPNGVPRRIVFVALATVDAESGKTYDLKIGRSGRRVTGRLVLPAGVVWMIRKAEIVPKSSLETRPVPIGVQVLEDVRFQAEDLRAGDYTLRIALHEPPPTEACGWGRLLGKFSHAFTVPDDAVNAPLDLGVLKPAEVGHGPLGVGDTAPDFTVKSLDGKDLKLADFRGKLILLDFWATWCAPCVAEMPNLKAVHDRFSNDPRFVLISVSLDEQPVDAELFVKRQKLRWLQGFIGPDSPVVSTYGATAIPATFLISPEGRILAKSLRGEKTMAGVTEALKP